MTTGFVKRKEDFTCLNCSNKIKGTGYTNHCSNCLFSLHVDELTPGDRRATCKGLMEPIKGETENGNYILIHKCLKCGKTIKNKTAPGDNFEAILKLLL